MPVQRILDQLSIFYGPDPDQTGSFHISRQTLGNEIYFSCNCKLQTNGQTAWMSQRERRALLGEASSTCVSSCSGSLHPMSSLRPPSTVCRAEILPISLPCLIASQRALSVSRILSCASCGAQASWKGTHLVKFMWSSVQKIPHRLHQWMVNRASAFALQALWLIQFRWFDLTVLSRLIFLKTFFGVPSCHLRASCTSHLISLEKVLIYMVSSFTDWGRWAISIQKLFIVFVRVIVFMFALSQRRWKPCRVISHVGV